MHDGGFLGHLPGARPSVAFIEYATGSTYGWLAGVCPAACCALACWLAVACARLDAPTDDESSPPHAASASVMTVNAPSPANRP